MSEKQVGGVTYQAAKEGYFEKRELKRHARIWSLWALGVGAVISGQFSGWNLGIASGGWGGLFIAALSRAGYYPQFLSVTHGTRKTPHMALLAGTAIGFAVLTSVWFSRGPAEGAAIIGGTLLNMAVFGAMISYAFQGVSFILLRVKMPDIVRPYKSPFGISGAAITIVIALITLYYQLQDPAYQKGVYAALAWYVAGVLYFALVGRHRLVLSPEEEFALSKGHSAPPPVLTESATATGTTGS